MPWILSSVERRWSHKNGMEGSGVGGSVVTEPLVFCGLKADTIKKEE